MKIKINIEKKHLFLFILAWLSITALSVFAQPNIIGHSSTGQIDWSQTIQKLNARVICLGSSQVCSQLWATGGANMYTAGPGIQITNGNVINLRTASTTIGGVKAKTCSSTTSAPEKMTGISGGEVVCGTDTTYGRPASVSYSCTHVCFCPPGWTRTGATGSGTIITLSCLTPTVSPNYNCNIPCAGQESSYHTNNYGNYAASCTGGGVTITCSKI
jgi:hypothetical protein